MISTDNLYISFSYLFHFTQSNTKDMSFNSLDPHLYDYSKIAFIHSVINAVNDMPNLDLNLDFRVRGL